MARPGFSDSHDLPGHGVQFSTGLSRSASLWSALISCYLPWTMCELSADYSDIAPSSRGRGHCSTLLHSLRVPCYNPSHCPVRTCTRHPGPGLQTCKQCLTMSYNTQRMYLSSVAEIEINIDFLQHFGLLQ